MTDKTLGAYQRHEKHDADHLASAEFARHPDGRTAMRSGPDLWKANVRGEQYNSWYGTSTDMARDGWIPVRECPAPDDHTLAKGYPAMSDRATSWQERAEKAERERDEALAVLEDLSERYGNAVREKDEWEANAENAEARADAAESRPLTPDAITDEMVERARVAALDTYQITVISPGRMRAALAAALTEPPARPEGAEDGAA